MEGIGFWRLIEIYRNDRVDIGTIEFICSELGVFGKANGYIRNFIPISSSSLNNFEGLLMIWLCSHIPAINCIFVNIFEFDKIRNVKKRMLQFDTEKSRTNWTLDLI